MPIKPNDILHERYRIIRTIGQGGMGAIFLAADLRLDGRQCAVKQVSGDQDALPESRQQAGEQFYREASTLARLDHPSLPKVSDFFSEDDSAFLVMDYVPGENLRSMTSVARREERFLKLEEVLLWTHQLIDALAYMHGQDPPIVHRDVKPENVRLTPSGVIKLVDFGLVKLLSPEERTITIVQGRGTAHYTPLEQYGGDTGHTTVRSDIYSLGATIYCLLTNEPPEEAKVRFLRSESLILIREINSQVSSRVERSIHWALGLHPENRPPDIRTFADALYSGIFPNPEGVPDFVPQTLSEWWNQVLGDPIQRNMVLVAGLLIALATVATVTGQ